MTAGGVGGGGGGFGGNNNPIQGIIDTVGFWQDPIGNMYETMRESAAGFLVDVLSGLSVVTMPDLSVEWFQGPYRAAFAIALLVACVLTVMELVRTGRGAQGGEALVRSLAIYWPAFILGSMFGPMIGWLLVNFFRSLSASITDWGITGASDSAIQAFEEAVRSAEPDAIVGGAFVGIILMLGVIIATLMVAIVLIMQLVTLYMTGVILPLSLVWLLSTNQRGTGTKVVRVWLVLLAAHPLVFFLLSVAFMMIGGQAADNGSPEVQRFVYLVASIAALFIAAIAPFQLPKFAPVMPGGNGQETAPRGASIGARSMHEQLGRDRDRGRGSAPSAPPAPMPAPQAASATGKGAVSATQTAGTATTARTAAAAGGRQAAMQGATAKVGAGAATKAAGAAGGTAAGPAGVAAVATVAAAGAAKQAQKSTADVVKRNASAGTEIPDGGADAAPTTESKGTAR